MGLDWDWNSNKANMSDSTSPIWQITKKNQQL